MPCDKVKYASKKMADEDIVRIQKKSKRATVPIRSYQCTVCKGWHLTSKINFTERIKELEAEADLLKTERDFLRAENLELKGQATGDDQEEHRQARIKAKAMGKLDGKVVQLTNANTKLEKLLLSLRKNNSELISQVVQLNKKLEGKQTP
jgi:hypothetical protein